MQSSDHGSHLQNGCVQALCCMSSGLEVSLRMLVNGCIDCPPAPQRRSGWGSLPAADDFSRSFSKCGVGSQNRTVIVVRGIPSIGPPYSLCSELPQLL